MSCERTLNFDQWKTFSENYKPMKVWLWLVYKFTENYCRLRLFSEFIQTQKRYPTSLGKICILTWKLLVISSNIFLWTKLLENLVLAKYLISVAAPLKCIYCWLFKHLFKVYIQKIFQKILTPTRALPWTCWGGSQSPPSQDPQLNWLAFDH